MNERQYIVLFWCEKLDLWYKEIPVFLNYVIRFQLDYYVNLNTENSSKELASLMNERDNHSFIALRRILH